MIEDIETYIDEKYNELSSGFLKEHEDEWCCEEQGMELIESDRFMDYCESKYEEQKNEI